MQNNNLRMIGGNSNRLEGREKNDFYATDPMAVKFLLQKEKFNNNVWENAYGQGHIGKELEKAGYVVRKSDIINRNNEKNVEIINFLTYNGKWNGDIITNPPFKMAEQFLFKSLDIIPNGNKVAFFLKMQFLEGIERYNAIYKNINPKKVICFSKRVICARNGDFHKYNATFFFFAWFIWEKGFKGNTILQWFPPDLNENEQLNLF